jgi:membrane protein DedA with SNARE-associated domain
LQESGPPRGALVPRSRYLLVIALASLAVGLPQALGLIQLPIGAWFAWLTGSVLSSSALNNFMNSYGYASVFALMALESASFPVPSEVVLPLAGYFVSQGALSFWPVVLVSTLASLTGALVDYYLAAWLGRPFVVGLLGLFRLHRNALDRAEAWFDRSAQWTVFAARFVPLLRTVISLPAGLFEMNLVRFVSMTLAGCFAWSVVLVYAGSLAGSASSSTFTTSSAVIQGLSALVAGAAAAYVAYYLYSSSRGKTTAATPASSVP